MSPLQEGLQDELSSYADDVFETASEAALKQVDESELTGSALDKSELERSHLMLYLYNLLEWYSLLLTDGLKQLLLFFFFFNLIQPIRARMEEG